ncbi:cell wall metabolism sensor histidine kinase WalK [Paenibacillus alginolyticus]|uniref:sensor histidine kinase n=1 Tax=Paenibacillus alginolyticus TaxID=59839 RepID=UPI00041C64E5|nr:ATP-binding protein [Paenibacillus alginolyticus]MCY9666386.1 cell wall metabolism sensor histidine kinase WalK [Paenibacillus alginolyticus]
MKWNRVVVKLGSTIIILFLVVLLPMGFVINQILTSFYQKNIQDNIKALSTRYAQALSDGASTVETIKTIAEFSDVKFFIINNTGKIIANSGLLTFTDDASLPDKDIAPLFEGKSLSMDYEEATTSNRYMVYGSPVMLENTVVGGVFVLSSIEGMHQSIQNVQRLLLLSGFGAFLLALGFTFVLSKKLSTPLIQMEQATRRIAKGDLGTRVRLKSNDEIGSLAQAINELAFDLKSYRDTRNEFFSNISHELRTPITYIDGYAKVLRNKLYQSETEKEHYLDLIASESNRLTLLIEDLFELSKMEEGKVSLEMEWIDLTEVMENAIQKCRLKLNEKGLQLDYHFDKQLPLIYGDGLRMEQVFTNLLENAIRYTNEGHIHTAINKENNKISILIEDTGIGIPEEELPQIFNRFYRVEKSRSREHGGSGLGLAIVKKLVELQGGNIQVSSELNKGTRFEIDFIVPTSPSGGVESEVG